MNARAKIPPQKWMNFYTKVLSKFAATTGLKLTLRVEVAPTDGVSPQKVEETKVALRELGLNDRLRANKRACAQGNGAAHSNDLRKMWSELWGKTEDKRYKQLNSVTYNHNWRRRRDSNPRYGF